MLSGYDHGVADASDPCNNDPRIPCITYIWKSPNGFINQTKEFIDGYVLGFCKIAGPGTSMDEPEADFWCDDGPESAGWMIGSIVIGKQHLSLDVAHRLAILLADLYIEATLT